MEEFKIEGEYIELIGLIKTLGLAESGGQAKLVVDAGMVVRNVEVETRRRAKLRVGDKIQIGEHLIHLL